MRSASGKRSAGPRLKKSPVEGANHRICRRKRLERTTSSLPNVVSARADSSASIPLQLEDDFRNRWHHLVDLLLSAVSGDNSKSAGGGIPHSADEPYPGRSSDYLRWTSAAPEQAGPGFREGNRWKDGDRILAGLCPGAQSRRIHLGTFETP